MTLFNAKTQFLALALVIEIFWGQSGGLSKGGGGWGGTPLSAKTLLSGWEGTLLAEKIRQTVYETLVVLKGETLFGVSSISSY